MMEGGEWCRSHAGRTRCRRSNGRRRAHGTRNLLTVVVATTTATATTTCCGEQQVVVVVVGRDGRCGRGHHLQALWNRKTTGSDVGEGGRRGSIVGGRGGRARYGG